MRPVVRALTAALIVTVGLLLATPAVQASIRGVQQRPARTSPASAHTLTISIDAVNPQWVTPTDSTVTVSGTLSNHTGSALSGITIQAQTSYYAFTYRAEMTAFASKGSYPDYLVPTLTHNLTAPVANGATVHWSVSFDAASYYYLAASVAVYPIEVQASAAGYQASARTFLPYWPGTGTAKPLQVGWVWPLIGTPQNGACKRTLATNALAASLAASGRLSRLLGSGLKWARADQLTWVIDPALLSNATVMTRRYFTGGNSACTDRTPHHASTAAASWLSSLKAGSAGEPAFLTPYDNADVAALSHAGLDDNLRSSYLLSRKVAGEILPGTFGVNGNGTGNGSVLAAAWPADGTADAGVLNSLATDGGIKTVVLNSGELKSSTAPYDGALAKTASSIGTPMSVLLADSELTRLLGSATNRSPAAGRFAVTQDFIAQTAMIVAEGPNEGRTLVVAPPPGWSPSRAEATKLLSMTDRAPWLRPTGLAALAAKAAKVPSKTLPFKKVSHAELTSNYLDQVRSVQTSLDLFKNLLYRPPAGLIFSLRTAFAATESSAWRGRGSVGGWLAVTKLAYYLTDKENKVQIITGKKILLAGASGTTPISVENGLDMPVQVLVQASTPPGSKLQVGPLKGPLVVQPKKTGTVYIPMRSAAIGTTTMKLQLVTRNGSPMTWTAQPLSVEVTRFGRALLLVIGGALAVLVLTAGVRLRRRRLADRGHSGGTDGSAQAGGAG